MGSSLEIRQNDISTALDKVSKLYDRGPNNVRIYVIAYYWLKNGNLTRKDAETSAQLFSFGANWEGYDIANQYIAGSFSPYLIATSETLQTLHRNNVFRMYADNEFWNDVHILTEALRNTNNANLEPVRLCLLLFRKIYRSL